MLYTTKKNFPGLRKGAILQWEKVMNRYYVVKDNYCDYYYFTKREVEKGKKWFRLLALILLLPLVCFSQQMKVYAATGGNTATWTTGNEASIMNYEVQDSVTKWVTLAEVAKGKSSYSYQLPAISAWIRIKAVGVTNFYTNAIYVSSSGDNVAITSPTFHSTSLTWVTSNEVNVSYFLIQKTRNGSTTQVTKYTAKGSGKYTYWMNITWYKYAYTIRPVFKDGTSGQTVNFK